MRKFTAQIVELETSSPLGWVSLLARALLGGSLLYAGILKIDNLPGSVFAVQAYDLPFPSWIITTVGYALPIFNTVVGAMIILGLFTRVTAALGGLSMLAFIVGMTQAWARGLQIDCGCFSSGGPLDPGEETNFGIRIAEDFGWLICAIWLVIFGARLLSLDTWLFGSKDSAVDLDDLDDDDDAEYDEEDEEVADTEEDQ